MTFSSPQYEHFLQLMADLAENRLTPEGIQCLESLLWNHPELRELYVDYQLLVSGLHWTCSQTDNLRHGMPWSLPEFAEEFGSADLSIGETGTQRENSPPINRLPRTVSVRRSLGLAPRLIGWAASLLLVGYFAAMAWLLISDRIRRTDEHEQLASHQSNEPAARLTHADDADWKSTAAGGQLKNRTLQVRTGLAELTFAQGANVVLEGPAEFEVRSVNGGFLRIGKLAAYVPPRAVGFEVETPTARVVDLGTDFRLEANSKETTLAVIAGKVDLFPISVAAGGGRPTSDSPRRVTAGQAVTIAAKANIKPVVQEAKFDAEWLSSVARALPNHRSPATAVAYQIPENASGNQRDFHGGVGLDFEVRIPIRVFSLGVFDHLGDGIDPATSPTVQLWLRDMRGTPNDASDDAGQMVLASQVFKAHDSGELKLGHRFKPLSKPIDLPVGSYSIVAYGLSDKNPCIAFENRHVDVDFTSEPDWIGSNNTTNGNNFGWHQTTDEAGTKIDEVGGTLARAQVDSFYGDTHLSDTFDLNDKITASGKFRIGNITGGWADLKGEGRFFIGHFSSDASGQEFIGLEFKESGFTSSMRVRARLQLSTEGDTGAESDWVGVLTNDNHTFSYTYDPNIGNGRLTLIIDEMPPLVVDLKPIERATDVQFDAFGIGATKNLSSENDPAKTAEVYLDDASFSGCQGSEAPNASLVELRKPTQVRVETCHNAIVPMGSRYGEGRPGTFPKIRGDRLTSYAAGSFEYLPSKEESSPSTGSGQGRQSVDK